MPRSLLALLLATAFASAAPVPKAKKADPIPCEVGTKWEYTHQGDEKKVTVEEITESESKDGVRTVRVDVNRDGKTWFRTFSVDEGKNWLTAIDDREFAPPRLVWKTDLTPGDTWQNKYTDETGECDETCTAGKPEEIKTPAGVFTATPIKCVIKNPIYSAECVRWYAAGIGLVRVTSAGTTTMELKSFTPGKK